MIIKKIFCRHDVWVCLFFVISTLAVYWRVSGYELINFDDDVYIIENRHVISGITFENIRWAFSTLHEATWQPLVWLSFMLDCQFDGINSGRLHQTNLFYHTINTLLLFLVLKRMTGNLWQSGFVAALFALHPLHVESVAWVTERKDVLSTFFWMLAMWSYVLYVEHHRPARYVFALIFFIMGLMAKPMLVTLPFVLLLIDAWPLGRFSHPLFKAHGTSTPRASGATVLHLILEKIPFVVFAAASCIITFIAQTEGGALVSLSIYSFEIRVANALVSYVTYIVKMFWPCGLAVFYPYPGVFSWMQVAGACLLLVTITFLAVKYYKQHPYLAVGWGWYLGTLVPVIGLVQTGAHSMADRFTYIPLIGLFIIIGWGVPELLSGWRYKKTGLAASALTALSILMIVTWFQVGHWANSIKLFEHTLKVTAGNNVAHHALGGALFEKGRTGESAAHFRKALNIKTDDVKAHNNLGLALAGLNRLKEAEAHYEEALKLNPEYAEAHYNLGIALARQGKTDGAITSYMEVLRLKPEHVKARNNLGIILFQKGRTDEAINHFQKALEIQPDYSNARNNLSKAQVAVRRNR